MENINKNRRWDSLWMGIRIPTHSRASPAVSPAVSPSPELVSRTNF